MITEKEKWQFCEDKECPYCLEDLGYYEECRKSKKIITGCPKCNRSFCE